MWFSISLPTRRSGVWVPALASPFGGSFLPRDSRSPSHRERRPKGWAQTPTGAVCQCAFRTWIPWPGNWDRLAGLSTLWRMGPDQGGCGVRKRRMGWWAGDFHLSSVLSPESVRGGAFTSESGSHCLQAIWPSWSSFFSFENVHKNSYLTDVRDPVRLLNKRNCMEHCNDKFLSLLPSWREFQAELKMSAKSHYYNWYTLLIVLLAPTVFQVYMVSYLKPLGPDIFRIQKFLDVRTMYVNHILHCAYSIWGRSMLSNTLVFL